MVTLQPPGSTLRIDLPCSLIRYPDAQTCAVQFRGAPLVLHAREAEDEVAAILREEGAAAVGGVIHCFTAHEELGRAGLEMGFSFPKTTRCSD